MEVETRDPQEVQRGASDPRASVWVAASAGTGKTKVLTDRVLRLLLDGTDARRMLCLTYTKAAAAEMANRIAERLSSWAIADPISLDRFLFELLGRRPTDHQRRYARELFSRVLDTPGGLGIQTIHAFCQSLLGRFPLEAGIAPHAAVMDERDSRDLLRQAWHHVLDNAERLGGPLADAIAQITGFLGEGQFREIVNEIIESRGRFAAMIDAYGSTTSVVAALRAKLCLGQDETVDQMVAAASAAGAFDGAALRSAAQALLAGSEQEKARGACISSWLAAHEADRAQTFLAYAAVFLTKDEAPRTAKSLINVASENRMPGARGALVVEAQRLAHVLARRRAAITCEATQALLVLGDTLLRAYQNLKIGRALLDYDDLIDRARRLLDGDGDASWVLYKLDGGVDHVLIDEAQDTSPDQWAIIRALTAEFFAGVGARSSLAGGSQGARRTVFAVGDVKQSIYSFQGADPASFVASRDLFARWVSGTSGDWRPIALTTSFRSTRAVLAAVDATFADPEMARSIALVDEEIVHRAFRLRDGGEVEVWPLVVPRQRETEEPWALPITRAVRDSPQQRLALLVAQRIEAMLRDRELLTSARRPIEPGDIMVLVRRRTSFVQSLVRALKERQVPVAGVDRLLLSEQLVVMDLLALARFALLPNDDLTLATVLKSPLIGFDEDTLFALAWSRKGTLWAALKERAREDPMCAAAEAILTQAVALADRLPPFEFFARALGPLPQSAAGAADTGRRRLIHRLGREAEDPLTEFMELAITYERVHPPSLQGFLHWVDSTDVVIKRDPEQGRQNAVRVLTVHGAKGLQAPIVFLPDTCQQPERKEKLLWLAGAHGGLLLWPPRRIHCEAEAEIARRDADSRQLSEYRRLLYVAMTRAGDRLIVCGWLNRNQSNGPHAESWYTRIRDGLSARATALGLRRDLDPFLSAFADIDGSIPSAEVLRIVHDQDTPVCPSTVPVEAALPPLPDWALRPPTQEPSLMQSLRPSHDANESAPPPLAPFSAGNRFQRGRLIHRLLQELPDMPPNLRDTAARHWLARPTHGMTADAQADIAAEVLNVLNDPRFAPLFGMRSRAEVPISGEINGILISGQIDRLLVTDERIVVLDYKSDRPAPHSAAAVPTAYLRQMAAYKAMLCRIYPDRAIDCVLLWTEVPLMMPLDAAALDRWAP